MSVTAGALSKVLIGQTTASLASAVATGGTGPYTYQWYRSVTTGFSPGAGSLISGATALALVDSGLSPGTQYFYKVIATDTGAGSATSTSAQLEVDTTPGQSQNQFLMSAILGQTDLRLNENTISVQVDASQAVPMIAGQAVKIVDSLGGIPKVVACAANSDSCMGFINYDIKSQQFAAGDRAEISMAGNVMYLVSTGAIARGTQVQIDVTSIGGVAAKTGSSGANIVGWAVDKATAAGQLIRVRLQTPGFTFA